MSEEARVVKVGRTTRDIHGPDSLLHALRKAVDSTGRGESTNQGISYGEKLHLIDKRAAREMRDLNAVHSSCLDAKSSSTVGLGHRDQTIHDTLDPLCAFSWQDTLDQLADDYWETGECFLEVVYDGEVVAALNHVESAQVFVEVEKEDSANLFHYVVNGETGQGATTVMARFGDLADLRRRFPAPRASAGRGVAISGGIVNSEIIHIRQGRNRSRWYGFPDYLSATPSIELVQCMTQHAFDFYFNRGVPEFLFIVIGQKISSETWSQIEDLIKASQGLGNSHKTGAIAIPGLPEQVQVQIEKLAMEDAGNDGFAEKSVELDMRIATAHGVPPILANILLPGKIGAANEGPNALLLFQKRKLAHAQRVFSSTFAQTLGQLEFAQPEGDPATVSPDAFLGKTTKGMVDENGLPIFHQPGNGFQTVLDGMTLGEMDAMSRMREPIAGSSRNPADGLLGGADDRQPTDPRRTR